ncbi:MAG TPA: choline kinase family protein [Candidatus Limnocylindrales bacterium]|jgi:thiamine kinase-like enzyme
MLSLDEVIGSIEGWRGRSITTEPVLGGLTNENYRVVVDGRPFFVRIPGPDTGLLAVDRANELHNTRAAAATGVGPQVIHALPEAGVIVLEWLDAKTMSADAMQADGQPERVAHALRRLHAGPRFLHDFNMFRLTERYLGIVDRLRIDIPAGYRERTALLPRIEAALEMAPLAVVPCHNDLLAENYLDDGRHLRIVDYEYSGNNDPCFELGNTCQELDWDDARIRTLGGAYFGSTTDALLARMRLGMIMSDVGWTLWAAIQARISPIQYDFRGWAEQRWARALAKIESPDLDDWLDAVRAEPRST